MKLSCFLVKYIYIYEHDAISVYDQTNYYSVFKGFRMGISIMNVVGTHVDASAVFFS